MSRPRGQPRKRARDAAGAVPPPEQFRALWSVVPLALVLALQLWTSRDRFAGPFLDTRLHYHYDNADFSFKARSGNRSADLRSQFGVTVGTYSKWGEPSAAPQYYTDHPFLLKALFQQYGRLAGNGEGASRSFAFAVGFVTAAGFYLVLLLSTGSVLASLAATTTLVCLPLFAVYQTALKFETDGMLVSVWLYAALAFYLQRGRPGALRAFGVLTGLAFLVHWTAVLFVVGLAAALAWKSVRGDARAGRALRVAVVAGAIGALALLGAMAYLQRGWGAAANVLVQAFGRRAAPIPAGAWWSRQWEYARLNFGDGVAWIVLVPALILIATALLRRRRDLPKLTAEPEARLLAPFGAVSALVAGVWVVAFRQGSFVHVYWQYWFCLPIAALTGAALEAVRPRRLLFAAATLACGALWLSLLSSGSALHASVRRDELGTPSDTEFLGSLREDRFDRLLFVPLTETPLNAWFQGPLFEYYTDRRIALAGGPADVRVGDKVLVLRYAQRADVQARLAAWSGKRLENEKCGSRICAYDVSSP